MTRNILQEACLIQLSTSCWLGTKKLDTDTISRMGNPEWLSGRKHLIDPDLLSPPRQVVARTRKYLSEQTLPFPVDSLALIPKGAIERVDARLNVFKEEFWQRVSEFCREYASARGHSSEFLGELFSEMDYPDDIRVKYAFNWRYVTMDVPGKHGILTSEIYQREISKFQSLMEDAREAATAVLRQEFADLVSHITERLEPNPDGTPKKFRDSTVNNFLKFFDTFNDRNLFMDSELEKLVGQAKSALDGVTPGMLRDLSQTRIKLRSAMEALKGEADASVMTVTRKLRFDPQEEAA